MVEDAEALAVGEHLVLVGQVGAAGVHQVGAGQAVLGGDLLRPQVLLHRQGVQVPPFTVALQTIMQSTPSRGRCRR